MTASRADIENWLIEGYRDPNNRYMLVVCDRFDYGDYPVYAHEKTVETEVLLQLSEDLRDVHEVYDMRMDWDDQLHEKRAWHLPSGDPPPPQKGLSLSCGCDLTPEMLVAMAKNENLTGPVVVCPEHGLTALHMT